MEPITFHLPTYPLPAQFSDPYGDWFGDPALEDIRRKDPRSLTGRELCFIFNSWLPAGTFEEMAAYVPHALRLLAAGDSENAPADLVEHLIIWCHLEQEAMARAPLFLSGMQDAFMQLFTFWTSNTEWTQNKRGCHLRYNEHIDTLLGEGDNIAMGDGWHKPLPWLLSKHYLPFLMELDSVPHAAWLLYVSDPDRGITYLPCTVPAVRRQRAIEMVEEWLLSSASPEDVELWDELLVRHRQQLALFPEAP